MSKVDLHIHSYFSDGECAPKSILKQLCSKDVSIFSLTDHNFILNSNDNIKRMARAEGISFIEGIEISSLDRHLNMSFHILGYSSNFDKSSLNKCLQGTIDGYDDRAKRIINKLNQKFPDIHFNFQHMKGKGREAYLSRNTIAKELCSKLGNRVSMMEALKKYVFIKEDNSWMLTPQECFKMIKGAGGVSILAHSGNILRGLGTNEYENLVKRFSNEGLNGIEVYCPSHSSLEIREMERIAKENSLFITGGSDWHGENYTPGVDLGVDLPKDELVPFLESASISVV